MPSGMPDSRPQKGSAPQAGSEGRVGRNGIRNEDGRADGHKWDTSDPRPFRKSWGIDFNDKNVDSMPNEGAPTLGANGVIGNVIE